MVVRGGWQMIIFDNHYLWWPNSKFNPISRQMGIRLAQQCRCPCWVGNVCLFVCADLDNSLENGEQESHGVQKPGKRHPTIPSAACWSAIKATCSLSWVIMSFLAFFLPFFCSPVVAHSLVLCHGFSGVYLNITLLSNVQQYQYSIKS